MPTDVQAIVEKLESAETLTKPQAIAVRDALSKCDFRTSLLDRIACDGFTKAPPPIKYEIAAAGRQAYLRDCRYNEAETYTDYCISRCPENQVQTLCDSLGMGVRDTSKAKAALLALAQSLGVQPEVAA